MTEAEVVTGVRISNLSGAYTGTISRVTRGVTLFRRRRVVRAFWIRWDHDETRGEAHMMPGDEEYLVRLDPCT